MKKTIFICSILLLSAMSLISCVSTTNVAKFYTEVQSIESVPEDCRLAENEVPKVFYSDDIQSDLYFVRSNYFQVIGYSAWNGPDEIGAGGEDCLQNEIVSFCKGKGAKAAIYSKRYTDTRNGVYSVPLVNNHYYTDSNGYMRSYSTTSFMTNSYSVNRYNYDVYFFVPYSQSYIKAPKIGIEFRNLDSADRIKLQRNTGICIDIVYENSPAFFANLSRGDVIIEINGTNILNTDTYLSVSSKLSANDSVEIKYIRNGKEEKSVFKIF
ncbi:MAG: PDZ domain-containing protein [Spirochaetales bacterium]|nr:PDZ domain-containing protein [Spirochaetales bacterium]